MTTDLPTLSPEPVRLREAGRLADGRVVQEITLSHDGLVLSALSYGGIVNALWVPDRDGRPGNVVRGFDRLEDYLGSHPYLGEIVGRYANRIAGGCFELDGEGYELTRNEGDNTLHGGRRGFGVRPWQVESTRALDPALGGPAVTLRHVSEHGEEGFPGRLDVRVTYSLHDGRAWQIDTEATTDRPTLVNLSHHDYFNLAGSGSALDHVLTIAASRYHPVDERMIPTGIADVSGTPFDFRSARPIGERIREPHAQIVLGHGYDHHWLLDDPSELSKDTPTGPAGAPQLAAKLEDPASGRTLALYTTEPGLQFYSANHLDGTLRGRGGEPLARHSALCLEPQHSPDSPHHPEWPSTVLRPGEVYRSRSTYVFGTRGRTRARRT